MKRTEKEVDSPRDIRDHEKTRRGEREPTRTEHKGNKVNEERIRVERVANNLRESLPLPDRVGVWERRDWPLAPSPRNGELLSEFVMAPKPDGSGLGVAGIAVTARPEKFEAELVFRMVPGLASILAEGESKLEVSDACVRFMKRHQTRESVRAEFRERAKLAPVDGDRWRSALGKRPDGKR